MGGEKGNIKPVTCALSNLYKIYNDDLPFGASCTYPFQREMTKVQHAINMELWGQEW